MTTSKKLLSAGRTFEQVLPPVSDQVAEFLWDGKDFLGNPVAGTTRAYTSVGFVYESVYMGSGYLEMSFAKFGTDITTVPTRDVVINWKHKNLDIKRVAEEGTSVAQGWSLSNQHYVSPADLSVLYKGDGSISNNNAMVITAVAGKMGYSGVSFQEGVPATSVGITPLSVLPDGSGNFYIGANNAILFVDTEGIITRFAGDIGNRGYSGDGGPAEDAKIGNVVDMALDSSGNLYFADSYSGPGSGYSNHCIRKVDTNGIITTVAGIGGSSGRSGDGGPAVQAKLYYPQDVAVDAFGNLYIADTHNDRIRKVDTNGIITTVAGGMPGYDTTWGDGGPADQATLWFPEAVDVDAKGNIYIADTSHCLVRKVNTSGIITTVAGDRHPCEYKDGIPAVDACIRAEDVSIDEYGNIYISNGTVLRKVDTDGIITTVAGCDGDACYNYSENAVEGIPAVLANINKISDVEIDVSGNVYVANMGDGYGHKYAVSKIAPASTFSAHMDDGDISFTEEDGTGYIMSSSGMHKKTIDLDTGTVLLEFGYDANDNLITITDRFNNQTLIERNENGIIEAIVSPYKLRTELTIDANNHLKRITNPDTGYYEFEYTTDGLMEVEIEPEKNRFDHKFDTSGRVTDTWDGNDGHWQFYKTKNDDDDTVYNVLTGENNLTTYLDRTDSGGVYTSVIASPSGGETLFSRSQDKLTVNKSLPCGTELEFKYDVDQAYGFQYVKEMAETTPAGLTKVTLADKVYEDTDSDGTSDLITEKVTVNEKETVSVHNILQATKTVTSPENRTMTIVYDPATLLTSSVSTAGLHDTAYGYDEKGRLKSVTTGTRETLFDYDTDGNLDFITDPEEHITDFDYDEMGRVKEIHRPDQADLYFSYDLNGNMEILTVPKPGDRTVDHTFGYNDVNLRESYQTPMIKSYGYIYDKDRRLTRETFPSGDEIYYFYEPGKGRLDYIQTPEGDIDFTYYPCGSNVDTISKGGETLTYEYDATLVTKETLAGTLNLSLGYKYNSDFDLEEFTYAGVTENFSYDDDGLLTGAGNFTITRKPENGLPEAVTGGNLNLTRAFNGYGETESENYAVNSLGKYSWNVTRDDNGRIRRKTETADSVTSEYAYDYDPMGRLLTVKDENGALLEEYRYDPNGTRNYEMNTHRGISGRSLTYYDDDCLMSAGDALYEYDTDGFLERKSGESEETLYDYSSRGELLSITLPDTTVIEYVHDPFGRRIAKKENSVIVEKYLWQGMTRLLAVYDGNNSLKMRFEYSDGRMPFAMTTNDSSVYYLTYDQVGSLRIVTDASGTVVKKIDYDSFGNIISPDTNPAFEVPFGFAGGLHDRDAGLVRFGFRDYDPDTGRWTAKDPIRFAGGDSDLYGYCMNNPVNLRDPLGLSSLTFDRSDGTITLSDNAGNTVGSWEAANNVTEGSSEWPSGTYDFSWHSPHSGSDANSSFGSNGNFIFDVPDRSGMGTHSGRANQNGPQHVTNGCIRTTDEATQNILETHRNDQLTTITVQD
ncbi:MAG: hypothetical protein GY795_12400 [Desulfobacterales bacterium]|nr:hypothetical protein [Desulfobacterales bacterium]